jgi:hypothetical protein
MDASRTLQNIFLLLPRSRYSDNAFRAMFSFDVSPLTSIDFRYDNTRTDFGAVDPFQVRVLDSVANSGAVALTRMVRQNQRFRGSYSIFKVTPMDRQDVADEAVDAHRPGMHQPSHFLTGEYRIVINRGAVVEFLGGAVKADTGNSYVWRVSGDKRLGDMWLGAGYSRTAAFLARNLQLPNGVKSNDLFELMTLRLRGEPIRSLALDIAVTGSRSVSAVIADGNKSLMGRARFDYRLSDRVTAFVNGETYIQNQNAYVNAPLDRNRLFVGLTYSFTSSEERRINRLNRDAEFVSLTDRERQRAGQQ